MNKLPKEKRDKLMLIAFGTAGILTALYLTLISPQQSSLASYAEKTESAKDRLAKAERWKRMAPGVQSRLDAFRKELEAKQEEMAPVDKFKWFYNTLDKFLAQHRVKLTDITREPVLGEVGVLPKFPFQAASFEVKLRACYQEFGSFLADFENQFPYMRVQNLEIEPEGASNPAFRDGTVVDSGVPNSNALAITMRVVTLVKPQGNL
ncbi:MAG: hypothetical protein U1G07_20225 [Verrucomicrobiota bacterium]